MILSLIFLLESFVPHLTDDPIGITGENNLKEAVRILQLDSLSILQKEINELTIKNENVKREKLILDQNIETLKNDQIEHIAMIKEKNENKIEALKKENAKKYELIEKNLIDQKEKLIKTKENFEGRI